MGKTGYTRIYRVHSITRVNMGKQDIQGYTGSTVLLGKTWVYRVYSMTRVNTIYKGIQGPQYY